MNELNGTGPAVQEVKRKDDVPVAEGVDLDLRRRASLMDNQNMLYAYSSRMRVSHDRDCIHVADIPDGEFQMLSEVPRGMKMCPVCYRVALIRSGIGADRRRMQAYERFFEHVDASNADLYRLVIKHKARLKWINNNVMQIKVHEDTWRVIRVGQGIELWHNNYIRLEDDSRHFRAGFHRQYVRGDDTFHNILKTILAYRWEAHRVFTDLKSAKQEAHNELLQEHERRKELKSALAQLLDDSIGEDGRECALCFLRTIFDDGRIKEFLKGARFGLSLKQLLIYANPELSVAQMKQIRSGLELHIRMVDVKTYAFPEISVRDMRKAKLRLLFKKGFRVVFFDVRDVVKAKLSQVGDKQES